MYRKPVLLILLLLSVSLLRSQIIVTIAGNATSGYSGDGGPALSAQLSDMYYTYPAIDNAGNIYIAQSGSNTIRKIDAAGIITTIAGTVGVIGYTGDGGPAVNALLYHPTYIVVDNAGNILFGDRNGDIIRKIDPSGIITTITGQFAVSCGVGDGGPLLNAQFKAISALSKDAAGNLYIADFGCDAVRKVNTAGIISHLAGNYTHGSGGDGGPAVNAQLAYPCKVAIDNAGNVYVPDAQNHRIRKIDNTGIITSIAGTGIQGYSGDGGPAVSAQLRFPGSVVIDRAGNLYIGDDQHFIRKIDPAGIITTFAGNGVRGYSGDGGAPELAALDFTESRISIDGNDNIYFNDNTHHVVRKIINCATPVIAAHPQPVNLCNGGAANFSVTATNVLVYQWQVNTGSGWNDISDNAVYSGSSTNNLMMANATVVNNLYQYRCRLTNSCGSFFTVAAVLSVTTPLTPAVVIQTPSLTNCTGLPVGFTATPSNAGVNPAYLWKRNGITVGTGNSLVLPSVADGDVIVCELTSMAGCVTSPTAISNTLVMIVPVPLTAAVSITSSTNGVCTGMPVTFTAATVNEGTSPHYTWFRNGTNLFLDAPTYTVNDLTNGEIIFCAMASSIPCITNALAISNIITADIKPVVTPTVIISPSKTGICKDENVLFTAVATNGGSNPVYQWKKNGIGTGVNSPALNVTGLLATDLITCQLISNAGCATTTTVNSNSVSIGIFPDPVVALDQNSTLCENSSRVLDAGNFSFYNWSNGATSQSIVVNSTGNYRVTVTDNNGCKGTGITAITTLLPSPAGFLGSDTAICSYGSIVLKATAPYKTYQWNNGSIISTLPITKPGDYSLQVTDAAGCTGKDFITVRPKECLKGLFVPTGFTPDGNGKNDVLRAMLFGPIKIFRFQIFNRWGERVFYTSDPQQGWDGKYKGISASTTVFIWTCYYQLEGEAAKMEKGTVTLIR